MNISLKAREVHLSWFYFEPIEGVHFHVYDRLLADNQNWDKCSPPAFNKIYIN